jgi:PAS domain S-box-containing protein
MARLTVLVVEDEAIVAMDLQQRLVRMGYTVVGTAMSAADAIEQAVALAPDLILLDIHLQGHVDGIEVATQVRQRLGIPVIFLTAHTDEDTLGRAKVTEPFGYLVKPIEDRALKIAIDMAAYKHGMDRKARQMERWLASTLSSLGDGIITTDLNTRVTYMNRVAEQLTGWSMPEAYGQPLADVFALFHRDTRAPVELPAPPQVEEGVVVGRSTPTCLSSRLGTVVSVDDSWAPLRDERGRMTGVIVVFRDVTAQESLHQTQARVREFQKIEALGRLAGGVAHEFNNHLTVLIGYSSLLIEGRPEGDRERVQLERILQTARRAAALTQQLLAVGRRQVLRPRVLDLNGVVAGAGALLGRLLGEAIRLEMVPAQDLCKVHVDPAQMEQVLVNLAANARDAMPGGGTVRLTTENAVLDADAVRHDPDVEPGPYALLTISDTGTGMDAATQQRIFEPFFSTRGTGKGMGLGLATVYGIVKQSGGHITVDSAPGHGSTFRLYLPAAPEAAAPAITPAPTALPTGTETILLVDDNPDVRAVASEVLRRLHYTVIEAGSGPEAVRLCAAHPDPIHLLLTDVVMPQLDGEEVARQVLAARPGLRVLYMSGYAESAIASGGALHGGTGVILHKPFTRAQLARAVRGALGAPDSTGGST